MTLDPTSRTLARLVESLVDCPDPGRRERALLKAIQGAGTARAVALWRRVGSGAGAWRAVLSRGPTELLPETPQVLAALDGELEFDLPGDGRVLTCSQGGESLGLVLGGVARSEEAEDLAEALFTTWCLACPIEAGIERAPYPTAPLPRADRRRELLVGLGALMAGLRSPGELAEWAQDHGVPEDDELLGSQRRSAAEGLRNALEGGECPPAPAAEDRKRSA